MRDDSSFARGAHAHHTKSVSYSLWEVFWKNFELFFYWCDLWVAFLILCASNAQEICCLSQGATMLMCLKGFECTLKWSLLSDWNVDWRMQWSHRMQELILLMSLHDVSRRCLGMRHWRNELYEESLQIVNLHEISSFIRFDFRMALDYDSVSTV